MPLLPRSRRGTWLLAAAVWLAACSGWWRLLPPVPRAVIQLDSDSMLLGFGPTGETAVINRWNADGSNRIDLLNVASGQMTTLLKNDGAIRVAAQSPDQRFWLVVAESVHERRFVRLDLAGGSAHFLAPIPNVLPQSEPIGLSPDGRHCVMDPHLVSVGVVIWDLESNGIRPVSERIKRSVAFSGDGRLLAGTEFDSHFVHVLDCETLEIRATFQGPNEGYAADVAFSPDGTKLACEFVEASGHSVVCWDVASGAEIVRSNMIRPRFARGGRSLIGLFGEPRTTHFDCVDLDSGTRRLHVKTDGLSSVSPDGYVAMVAQEQERRLTAFEIWAQKLGFNFLLPFAWRAMSPVGGEVHVQFIDLESGSVLAHDWIEKEFRFCGMAPEPPPPFEWLPGQRAVAVRDIENRDRWRIWALPARPSAGLFFAGAAVAALPIAIVARWRARKLIAA